MNQAFQRPLPPNWEAKYDQSAGRYFFVNHVTRSTQWKDPRIDFYGDQYQAPESIPMRVIVKPKCSTCRIVEVNSAGQNCGSCIAKKQQQEREAKAALEREAAKKRREEAARIAAEQRRQAAAAAKAIVATEAEKREVRRKLAQMFPNVSPLMINMSIETTKCDFNKAANVLRMVAEDSPKHTKGSPKPANSSPKKTYEIKEIKTSPKKTTQPAFASGTSDNASSSTARPSTSSSVIESRPEKPSQPATTAKKADNRVKFAPVVIKAENKTFNSKLAVGPNAALVKGSNVDLLIDNYMKEKGPDAGMRHGANPAYVSGPMGNRTNKENIAAGPDTSNLNGPQMLLYQGELELRFEELIEVNTNSL
ncbi:uncharacterized protein LOC117117766 isoform X2 [Anneissia japonica]|uniref:uncharacterized protein LOC117117766 isoform X2 n=1 Tax=Anneissia japonica TaxID=1529436 RepID=UPI0014257DA3|nr:uncharacterized protein LOC117117766 isoform X2 [Anneissia japonica]